MGDIAQDRVDGRGNITLIGRIVDDRGVVGKVEPPPADAASTDTGRDGQHVIANINIIIFMSSKYHVLFRCYTDYALCI